MTVTSETSSPEPFTELEGHHVGRVRQFLVRRPRVMDAVVMLAFAVPAAASVVFPYDHEPALASLGFIALGTAALAWRRQHPLVVAASMGVLAVLCTATTGRLSGFDLGIGLAVYAVAVALPARVAWTTAAALVAVTTLAVALWEQPVEDPSGSPGADGGALIDDRLASVVGVLVFSLAALAIGSSVRNRRQSVRELVDRANALARDRERQAELARVTERNRIAREMHDVVAHSLTVMVALADGAGAALDRAPESSRAALDELSTTGRSALADMRRILGVLDEGDTPLAPQPGSPGLDALVERFRSAGMPLVTRGLDTPLPDDAGFQLTVYRVVQEALTNTLRHAPGTPHAQVTIDRDDARVRIDVLDHGAGRPPTADQGSQRGLIGMAERVQAFGGTLSSGPEGPGWRVHVVLPCPPPDRSGARPGPVRSGSTPDLESEA